MVTNIQDLKKYMGRLSVEVTRRCNMNCTFCFKGQAQNLSITKEIIDKTLDEVTDVLIGNLRITGGEPLLECDLASYLLDKAVEKNIVFTSVCIFTNGTITPNAKLIKSIQNTLVYMRQYRNDSLIQSRKDNTKYTYEQSVPTGFNIIFSETERNTPKETIAASMNCFLNQIDDEYFKCIKQGEQFATFGLLDIEGNAKKNYKELLNNKNTTARIINNNYYFYYEPTPDNETPIKGGDFAEYIEKKPFIEKTLTVSANGNVFPGISLSYNRVDSNPMFNIMDCKHDFFEKVKEWCWKHPINDKEHRIKELFLTAKFLEIKGIAAKPSTCQSPNESVFDRKNLRTLDKWINEIEKITKDFHKALPTLTFSEVELVAIAGFLLRLYERGVHKDDINYFLTICTDLDNVAKEDFTPAYCQSIILAYTKINEERSSRLKGQNNEETTNAI
ncbi:MAG: 4Fe-4S cluster-binding domain-containing protein [Ruminococcus sp.]|nr:4Fe-4S cluster-binding domain-containing protein [Ruminococcus sp.]